MERKTRADNSDRQQDGGQKKPGRKLIALLFASTCLAAGMAAFPDNSYAQAAAPRQAVSLSIPAQPLASALDAFSRATGWEVGYSSQIVQGKRSRAVSGTMAPAQALQALLAGSGIRIRLTGPTTAALVDGSVAGNDGAVAADGSLVLDTIDVEGRIENAFGHVDGLIAQRSGTGSKTDTPIVEIPQSVSVVTANQAREMGAQTVSEAFRYTPGIDSEAYGFDARFNHFTVRGFQIDKYQFVDGMRFAAGGYAIPRIDPYSLERLEVLRGPSSGLYGQNVPGGMINLVTKRPTEEPLREVQLGTGYPGRIAGAFDFSGAVDPEKTLLYRFTGAGSFADTQVDETTDQRFFVAPSFTYKPDEDTSLTILAHLQKDKVDGWSGSFLPMQGTLLPNPNGRIPVSTFIGEPGYDHYKRDQYAGGYEFEHNFSEDLKFRSSARYADVNVDAPNIYPDFLDPDLRTLNRTTMLSRDHVRNFTADNNLTARFDLGPTQHTVLAGFDYEWLRDRDRFDMATKPTPPIDIFNPVYGAVLPPVEPVYDNDITQNRLGLYLQDQIRLDNWLLTLGGRQDWADTKTVGKLPGGTTTLTDAQAFTGRVGLSYLFDNGLAPYVSYSTSFEPAVGTTYNNIPFVPTTGQQYEAGIKFQPTGTDLFLSAALYQLTQQNVVTDDTRPGVPPFSQIQEGEIRVRGFELEAKASVWNGWDLIGSYTYSDAVTTRSNTLVGGVPVEGKSVPSVPRHQASLWAKYTFENGALAGLGLGAGVRYRSSLYGDNINQIKVPAVTLVDAALSYDFGKKNPQLQGMALNVNASNLFGKKFVANCSYGVCYYGEGRSATATLSYRW